MIKKFILFPLGFISVVLFSFYFCEAALSSQQASWACSATYEIPAIKVGSLDRNGINQKIRHAPGIKGILPSLLHGESGHEGVRYLSAKADSFKNEKSKIKIGIIEFQSLNEEAKKDILGKVFSEVLTTSFVNSNAFKIIEREQLEKVLKELQLTQTGIIDTAYAKQIGKMLGADAILTGTVIKFGNDLRVDARIIDVESGLILTAEKGMGKADLKSISTMADSIVQNLVNKFYRNKK
jgi:TolB-like protein